MRKLFRFFSRHKRPDDQLKPRTMAESQLEDLAAQKSDTPERKRFDEKVYEKTQRNQNGKG